MLRTNKVSALRTQELSGFTVARFDNRSALTWARRAWLRRSGTWCSRRVAGFGRSKVADLSVISTGSFDELADGLIKARTLHPNGRPAGQGCRALAPRLRPVQPPTRLDLRGRSSTGVSRNARRTQPNPRRNTPERPKAGRPSAQWPQNIPPASPLPLPSAQQTPKLGANASPYLGVNPDRRPLPQTPPSRTY